MSGFQNPLHTKNIPERGPTVTYRRSSGRKGSDLWATIGLPCAQSVKSAVIFVCLAMDNEGDDDMPTMEFTSESAVLSLEWQRYMGYTTNEMRDTLKTGSWIKTLSGKLGCVVDANRFITKVAIVPSADEDEPTFTEFKTSFVGEDFLPTVCSDSVLCSLLRLADPSAYARECAIHLKRCVPV